MNRINKAISALTIGALLFGPLAVQPVSAARLTTISNVVSTMKAATAANHTISFVTPTGVAAGQTMTVTFDAGYVLTGVVFGDIDVSNNGIDLTLAATPSAATWGAAVSGQVLTITSGTGTIAAGNTVVIKIGSHTSVGGVGTHQIINGAAGNDKTITIGGTFGDSGQAATAFLSNDVVTLDATVNATLSFAVSANAMHFGSLSSATPRWADATTGQSVETSGHNLTVSTNATNGYNISYYGDTLKSGSNSIPVATIAGSANGTPGTAQFAANYSISGGTGGSVAAGYEKASNNHKFVANTLTTLASGNVPTGTTTYSAYYLANISPTTPAGSYSTAITYTATGNF